MTEKKTSPAQRRASEKWKEENKARSRYINQRSSARSFIRKQSTGADLNELTQIIQDRRQELKGEDIMKTIYYQIQQYITPDGTTKPNNKVIEATLVDHTAKTWTSSAIPVDEFDDADMIDADFIPSIDQTALRDDLEAKGYRKAKANFFK